MLPDAETRVVTLIGDPVAHSRSPRIHNTAFAACDVNAVYVATPVRPGDVGAAIDGLRAMHFLGANVTIPHKQAVMPYLDDVSERAAAVGAINTLVADTSSTGALVLRGDNTDVEGFLAPLDRLDAAVSVRNGDVVVFGAGGAARAVTYGLLRHYTPDRLTLVARRPEQAEGLADDLGGYDAHDALRVTTFDDAAPAVRTAHLLVNTTPLGMPPHDDQTPWPDVDALSPGQIAYDLVYAPEETRFLSESAARGATTIGGLGMLVGQAAAAFTQWTGEDFPHDVVFDALRDDA